MWEVKNRTPFKAAGAFERNVNGHESWCVAVRATFDFSQPTALKMSAEQQDVRHAPTYADDSNTELKAEQDCAAYAIGTDILLQGKIRPERHDTLHIPLKLQVGKLTKSARLFGPRTAKRGIFGWRIEDAQPVQDTIISWRHSFGGTTTNDEVIWNPANPIGTGVMLAPNVKGRRGMTTALPLFDAETTDIITDPANAQPVGFGAIARNWAPRLDFAGTYDSAWMTDRAPLLPKNFDPRFYNTAPLDQQVTGFLKGGETVSLIGFMTDMGGAFRLPQVVLAAQTLLRRKPIDTRFNLLRIEIDIDTRQLSMVWVTRVPCNGDDASIQSTIVRVKQMSGVAS